VTAVAACEAWPPSIGPRLTHGACPLCACVTPFQRGYPNTATAKFFREVAEAIEKLLAGTRYLVNSEWSSLKVQVPGSKLARHISLAVVGGFAPRVHESP
jgi:hypothetical protein